MTTLDKALLINEKYYKVWDNLTNSWFKAGYSRKSKWATKAGASNAIGHYKKFIAIYTPPIEYDLTIVEYSSAGKTIKHVTYKEDNK